MYFPFFFFFSLSFYSATLPSLLIVLSFSQPTNFQVPLTLPYPTLPPYLPTSLPACFSLPSLGCPDSNSHILFYLYFVLLLLTYWQVFSFFLFSNFVILRNWRLFLPPPKLAIFFTLGPKKTKTNLQFFHIGGSFSQKRKKKDQNVVRYLH